MKIVGTVDFPKLSDYIKSGQLTIFDLSSIVNFRKKQAIVAYIAEKLFLMRRKEKLPPFLLIVEEAHNFAKEKAEKSSAISKGIMETIAREGRKFGAAICLVSQRPKQLSTTALSQCNSFLILRITNPYDLKHIEESCESINSEIAASLTTLKVGEGILIGEAINFPVFLKIRDKVSKKFGKGESFEEIARKYEEERSIAELVSKEGLAEAFL